MVFDNKHSDDEDGGALDGVTVDLEDRVCEDCRSELPSWVDACPHCGGKPVARTELAPPRDPLLERLLADEDADADDGREDR